MYRFLHLRTSSHGADSSSHNKRLKGGKIFGCLFIYSFVALPLSWDTSIGSIWSLFGLWQRFLEVFPDTCVLLCTSASLAWVLWLELLPLAPSALVPTATQGHRVVLPYVVHESQWLWCIEESHFLFSAFLHCPFAAENKKAGWRQGVKNKTKCRQRTSWEPNGAGVFACEGEWTQIKQPYPWPWQHRT